MCMSLLTALAIALVVDVREREELSRRAWTE